MRKYLVLVLLVALTVTAQGWTPTPVNPRIHHYAGTMIQKVIGSDTFAYVEQGEGPATGLVVFATPTVSIAAGAGKINLGSYIATNAQAVEIKAWGDDLVINESTKLATGTYYVGFLVSSGSSRIWTGPILGGFYAATRNGLVATLTLCGW